LKAIQTPAFIDAAHDYLWLQDKNYPQRLVYKIVCDRYRLNTLQRVVLYRGIFPAGEVLLRSAKRHESIDQVHLTVDTFNVLFKIANYLCGRPVFISNDHILRDAGDAFDKDFANGILERSVDLLIARISKEHPLSVRFLIDQPVDHSERIATLIEEAMHLNPFPVEIELCYPADRKMQGAEPHTIATADSVIIDSFPYSFIDLARQILDEQFQPGYLSLPEILQGKR
jgi:hypothetical protein